MKRSLFWTIISLFRVDTREPELMRAQLDAFTKQIPLLYLILAINSTALAVGHYGMAPTPLVAGVPAILIVIIGIRAKVWLKRGDEIFDADRAAKQLRQTVVLGSVLAVAFLGWSLALMQYGHAVSHGQVYFYIGLTAVSCIFCLTHLRPAALAITTILVPSFTIAMFMTGDANYIGIGINLALVAVAMVYILFVQARDFKRLVHARIHSQSLSEENMRMANIDSLTSLANRRQFFGRLEQAVADAERSGAPFVVGVIDLDGFKPVNDLYGHLTGDRLLVQAGERLKSFADADTFVARLGGDEFGLIRFVATDDAMEFGRKICDTLAITYALPGVDTVVSASMGLVVYQPHSEQTSESLYESADYALYHAKHSKRGRCAMFTSQLRTSMRDFLLIEHRLRAADMEKEFTLQFQPLFRVGSQRPVAFEALARWNAPEIGNVAPNVFIPVAERTDLINALTQTLLRKALAVAAEWPDDIRLTFNLSIRDLVSREAVLAIIAIIRASGVAPRRIDLEVTESALITDFDKAREAIVAFKALGVEISLDDFGTGYSSLSYVHKLPFDRIKIDRSFVQEIDTHDTARDIVRTVVDLCRNLNLQCVTEGVETADQANVIEDLGCDVMQGYYFARPMDRHEADNLARKEAEPLRHAANW